MPAFRIDERAFFLAPTGRGQNEIGHAGGLRRVVHVLHDEKIEPFQNVPALVLIDPRMGRVRADHPQAFDLPAENAFDDLMIRQTVFVGDETAHRCPADRRSFGGALRW